MVIGIRTPSSWWEWALRLLRGDPAPRVVPAVDADDRPAAPARPLAAARAVDAETAARGLNDIVRRLVVDDRYVFVLLREADRDIDASQAWPAWKALENQMAVVPGGAVPVVACDGTTVPTQVDAFYLDRCTVTNEQFARFVRAG